MARKGKLAGKEIEIIRLYEGGESICTLAPLFDVAPQSIWRILKCEGVIRNRQETNRIRMEQGRVPIRPELRIFDRDKATKMYQQGMCMQEIAEIYHCSLSAISKVFHKFGISRNPSDAHFLSREKGRWIAPLHLGDKNPGWKGGVARSMGYIYIYAPGHPRATKGRNSYVAEHILVLEKKLGRPLLPNEIGHHLNGIKDDNRPENLVAMTSKKHSNVLKILHQRIQELEAELAQRRLTLS